MSLVVLILPPRRRNWNFFQKRCCFIKLTWRLKQIVCIFITYCREILEFLSLVCSLAILICMLRSNRTKVASSWFYTFEQKSRTYTLYIFVDYKIYLRLILPLYYKRDTWKEILYYHANADLPTLYIYRLLSCRSLRKFEKNKNVLWCNITGCSFTWHDTSELWNGMLTYQSLPLCTHKHTHPHTLWTKTPAVFSILCIHHISG
jgi:hypothetical protein